jgi:hypothetical protein
LKIDCKVYSSPFDGCYKHYYLQYWPQGDVKENFDQHLFLFHAHYYFEKLLELVKIAKANLFTPIAKIYP